MKKRIVSLVLAMAMCFALGITSFAAEPQEINWAEEEYRFDMTIDEKIAWMDAHNIPKYHYKASNLTRDYSYVTSTHTTYAGPTYADESTPYLNVCYLQSKIRYYIDGTSVTSWEDYSHNANIYPSYRMENMSLSDAIDFELVGYSPDGNMMRVNYSGYYRTIAGIFMIDQIYYLYPDGDYYMQPYVSSVTDIVP